MFQLINICRIAQPKIKDSCNFDNLFSFVIERPLVQVMFEVQSADIVNSYVTIESVHVDSCDVNGKGKFNDNSKSYL